MSQIVPFMFETLEIRTLTNETNDLWFVLKDVLDAMGTATTTTNALDSIAQGLGDGYSAVIPIPDALGRSQETTIVAEAGATYLVARSNTEQGKRLNRFIHIEVLPQIRKTGAYAAPLSLGEQLLANAQAYLAHERRIASLEKKQVEVMQTIHELTGGEDYTTIKGYARTNHLRADRTFLANVGKRATAICRTRGIATGKVNDDAWDQVNSYPRAIVAEAFKELLP
ncbi:MAG: hypothetical protein EOM21_19690 [Gammaproteobacteria bacterium]|nr:hypothetical protein [Gammaproteobacteria bacterium]